MATLLLSAAGAALGGSLGGTVAGLATGVVGKALGATAGAMIDQRLTGLGSEPVETGRVERFRVMGASEGEALPRVFGRVRVAGQVIWSSRFLEDVDQRRVGGKGAGGAQEVREHSYSISVAVALCEGEVTRVGRIWADGQALDLSTVTWRLHVGSETQAPDPLIAAIEGVEEAPAYRGTAYVVFENLQLATFGNRIPQFNFEVFRRAAPVAGGPARPAALDVRGVALVPGTGEYSLATTPVLFKHGRGRSVFANVNNDRGRPDLLVSLEQLEADLPAAKAVSLVVSWFGDDLRCDRCTLRPAVEQAEADGQEMPWRVSGQGRAEAKRVSRLDDRPAFGGTPTDASVIQAIRHMRDAGKAVMFYPFILMDILGGNGLTDPWTGEADQPRVPWRGRITLSAAPGRPGSPDRTAAAAAQVAEFFGAAARTDFTEAADTIVYAGPDEWSYRRFVLHYAHLCRLAGGVDAFCIGSEMRSLTQIRDGGASYPAVRAMCTLAADVRAVLGPEVKIGYAADWSEYFGHHPADGSGDVLFHLDPLWAHSAVDFVGIDNYMPLSDWRDGTEHADAAFGSIYDLGYLHGNVAGGEGYDWFYRDQAARERQQRTAITDGAHGEPWVFRYKDMAAWWSRPHHDRRAGVRASTPTAWVPKSKPIWFTELGCPAVDKGTNQPNVFVDPKSAESFLPYFSTGARDDFGQQRYLQAMFAYWADPANNPASDRYAAPMVDLEHAFVWAWDARPWPDFPDRIETWSDGDNFALGHWINARIGSPTLSDVVAEVCERSGVSAHDVRRIEGCVTGYTIGAVETGRQSLQPLMLVYGFDSFGLDGRLAFARRSGVVAGTLPIDATVVDGDGAAMALTRGAPTDAPGRVLLGFVRAEADYQIGAAEVASPETAEPDSAQSSVPIVLDDGAARGVAERWLSEARVARDTAAFELPPSALCYVPGDVVRIEADGRANLYRIDRVDDLGRRSVSAIRIEASLYRAPVYRPGPSRAIAREIPGPVDVQFLDLPLLTGEEVPHAPHVAVSKTPWTGAVSVYASSSDSGYALDTEILRPAVTGSTLDPLPGATAGLRSRRPLRVRLNSGSLRSVSTEALLNGANAAAVRGTEPPDWEVLQFERAELVAPGEYVLSGLLRGQAGTDGVLPAQWPVGAEFVLLDGAVRQIGLPPSARGLTRHHRIGPAGRPYSDPSYVHVVESFDGVGLRPYRPAHLRAVRSTNGDIVATWVRRTRVDGDNWQSRDAPLGEEREAYLVRILVDGVRRREEEATSPRFTYTAAMQSADGAGAALEIEVAQISERFGPGPGAVTVLATGF